MPVVGRVRLRKNGNGPAKKEKQKKEAQLHSFTVFFPKPTLSMIYADRKISRGFAPI